MRDEKLAGFKRALLREQLRLQYQMNKQNPAKIMAQLVNQMQWNQRALAKMADVKL